MSRLFCLSLHIETVRICVAYLRVRAPTFGWLDNSEVGLRRLRGISHRYLSEMSHLILSWRIAGVEGAVMISHRCLKPGRNPAVSAATGSVPILE